MKAYSPQRCNCRKSTEAFDPRQNILCEMPADLGEAKRGWAVISETAVVAESSAYFSPVFRGRDPKLKGCLPPVECRPTGTAHCYRHSWDSGLFNLGVKSNLERQKNAQAHCKVGLSKVKECRWKFMGCQVNVLQTRPSWRNPNRKICFCWLPPSHCFFLQSFLAFDWFSVEVERK